MITFGKNVQIFDVGIFDVGGGVITLPCSIPVLRVAPEPTGKEKSNVNWWIFALGQFKLIIRFDLGVWFGFFLLDSQNSFTEL